MCTDNGFLISGGSGSYNGQNTTFAWSLCANPPACPTPVGGFKDLGHFSIKLSGLEPCGGASIAAGTTTPYTTSDPPCFGSSSVSVINWDADLQSGDCADFVLVLAGQLETGTVQAGTKAGDACPLMNIVGPVCP